jgi:hypothetical protein
MSNNGVLSVGRPSAKTNKAATLSSLADQKEIARVNFELSAELHTKLKVYAAKHGKSIKEVLTEVVEQFPE